MSLSNRLNKFLLKRKLYKVLRGLSIFGLDNIYRYAKKIYQNERDVIYGTDYQRSAQRALDNITDARYDIIMRQALIRLKAEKQIRRGTRKLSEAIKLRGESNGRSVTELDTKED